MTEVKLQTKNIASSTLALEEAYEAVTKLRAIKPFLSPKNEETLSILMDKELSDNLKTSLVEADTGKLEPIESILK